MTSQEQKSVDVIKEHMLAHNRPFSVNDLDKCFCKDFAKTVTQKALETLVEQNILTVKLMSKQKLYFPNQSQFASQSDKESAAIEEELQANLDKLRVLKESCKTLEKTLSDLSNSLTVDQLKQRVDEYQSTCIDKRKRLELLQASSPKVSVLDKDKIEKLQFSNVEQWRKRKRKAMEMLEPILENYPKRKKDLYDEVGIVLDDDVVASLSSS